MADNQPLVYGSLTRTLAARHSVKGSDPDAPLPIPNRDALIYTLGKAAELEHLIICQYLFCSFSLKRDVSEGISAEKGVACTLTLKPASSPIAVIRSTIAPWIVLVLTSRKVNGTPVGVEPTL
jgi:hypothetical protein